MLNFSGAKIFAPLFMGAKISHPCAQISHPCAQIFVTLFMGAKFSHLCFFSNFVPLTSDDHNFFVRTSFEVFLDSMESPLSQESIFMLVEDKWGSQP